MKAVAICGSPRKNGNTAYLLERCLGILKANGIAGQLIQLADYDVNPCIACYKCRETKDRTCAIKNDDFNVLFPTLYSADIIILGSPVYFGSATPNIMALLDRAGFVSRGNDNVFSRKIGGAIAVARRAGQNFTFAQLVQWFMINDMIVPGSTYWNIAHAANIGDVQQDKEALATIDRFAENLAWLAKKTAT